MGDNVSNTFGGVANQPYNASTSRIFPEHVKKGHEVIAVHRNEKGEAFSFTGNGNEKIIYGSDTKIEGTVSIPFPAKLTDLQGMHRFNLSQQPGAYSNLDNTFGDLEIKSQFTEAVNSTSPVVTAGYTMELV